MPGGDRTGPAGWGPMTGRGAGFCAGYPVPGFMDSVQGRGGGGRGWGRGAGGGWRHRHWFRATGMPGWQRAWAAGPAFAPPSPAGFSPPPTKEQELEALKQQAKYFERALDELRSRIREIESSAEGSRNS